MPYVIQNWDLHLNRQITSVLYSSLDKPLMCVHKLKILIYIYIQIDQLMCTDPRQKFGIDFFSSRSTQSVLGHAPTRSSPTIFKVPMMYSYGYHILRYTLAKAKVANNMKLPRNGHLSLTGSNCKL